MVVLASDNGVFYELPVPGKVTIGRGSNNNIQPDSQSISKNHAAIIIELKSNGQGITAYVEDYGTIHYYYYYLKYFKIYYKLSIESRNGTFVGSNPMEISKVNGKYMIKYGDYIRFGNATKFYRFLEFPPPVDETSRDQDSNPILPIPLQGVNHNEFIVNNNSNNSSLPPSSQITQTQILQQNQQPTKLPSSNNIPNNSLSRSLPDRRNQSRDNHYSYHESRNDQKNMTISINYPASDLHHPLAIHIDPTTGGSGYKKNNIPPHIAPQYDSSFDKFGHNIGNNIANNFAVDDENSNVDEEINNIMKYNNNLLIDDNKLYKSNEIRRISPEIHNSNNSNITEIDTNKNRNISNNNLQAPKLRYDRYNSEALYNMEDSNNYPIFAQKLNEDSTRIGLDNKPKTRISSDSNSFAILLRSKESGIGTGSAVQFQSTKPRIEPILAELINLMSLHSSAKIDFIINEILGHNANMDDAKFKDGNNKIAIESLSDVKVPLYVQAEIIAEDLQGGDVAVISNINSVLYELNSLLRQSHAGMLLDEISNKEYEVSNEFDQMMQGFTNNLLNGIVNQIQSVMEHPIIVALITADDDGYKSNIGNILNILNIRISRLYSFLSGNYLASDFNELTQKEVYEVQTFVLSKVVEDIDYTNKIIWNVIQAVDNAVAHTTGIILPKSSKFISGDSKVTGTSVENNKLENKNILSNELEELRKLKEIDKKTKEEDTRNKKLKKMASNLTNYFIYCRFAKWKNQVLNFNKVKMKRKLLSRMIRNLSIPGSKIVTRAFYKWNKIISMDNNRNIASKDEELCKAKNELYNCLHKLAELENNNDLIIGLNAERALNRELSNMNRELRICLQELDSKLLECTQGPIAQRKCLVRDVLLSREEQLAIARREARSLREEYNRLQQSIPNYVISSSDPIDKSNSPERGNSPVSKKYLDKHKVNKESDKISKKGIVPPQLNHSTEMSKSIAKQVVMYEVRRLMVGFQQLKQEKNNLSNKLIMESNHNIHLTTALQALEVRLHNRERSQHALLVLLKQRLGEKGINELIDALEEMGAGSNALLKDFIPYKIYGSKKNEDVDNPAYENIAPRELDTSPIDDSKVSASKEEFKNAVEMGIFG